MLMNVEHSGLWRDRGAMWQKELTQTQELVKTWPQLLLDAAERALAQYRGGSSIKQPTCHLITTIPHPACWAMTPWNDKTLESMWALATAWLPYHLVVEVSQQLLR